MEKEHWLIRFIRHTYIMIALEGTIAVLVSYYACYWVSFLYHFQLHQAAGLWGSISAILVLAMANKDAWQATKSRIIGSCVGAVSACVFLYIFGYNVFSYGFAIFTCIVVTRLIQRKDTFRIACVTVMVIIIVGNLTSPPVAPWLESSTRFLESIIGAFIALITVICIHPIRKRFNLFPQQ